MSGLVNGIKDFNGLEMSQFPQPQRTHPLLKRPGTMDVFHWHRRRVHGAMGANDPHRRKFLYLFMQPQNELILNLGVQFNFHGSRPFVHQNRYVDRRFLVHHRKCAIFVTCATIHLCFAGLEKLLQFLDT